VSRGVWKVVETKARKIGVAKTKEERKEREEKEEKRKKKKKPKKRGKMEVRKVIEEWKIWDEMKEVVKSEEEAKKLVPEKFYK